MANLKENIDAYRSMQEELERDHFGEWVVVHNQELIGTYNDFQDAAGEAVKRFGRGPYLIRQIGAPETLTLPASVLYRPVYDSLDPSIS